MTSIVTDNGSNVVKAVKDGLAEVKYGDVCNDLEVLPISGEDAQSTENSDLLSGKLQWIWVP